MIRPCIIDKILVYIDVRKFATRKHYYAPWGLISIETIKKGVLETDIDTQTLHFKGSKSDNGSIEHILTVKIEHVSSGKRSYSSARLCDSWGRCEGDPIEFKLVSSNSSNCTTISCNHSDVMEFNFSDEFLRSKVVDSGFTDGLTMKIIEKGSQIKLMYLQHIYLDISK